MTMITVTKQTRAPAAVVWDLMADFGAIDFFNPNLSHSFLLSEEEEIGVGTLRQCNINDGKNFIRERVTEWVPGERYTIDIYEGTMPVKNAKTTLSVVPQAGGSLISMHFSYTPGFGVLGPVMDVLALRRTMRGLLQKVVDGLAEKAELVQRQQPTMMAAE